MHRLSRAQIEDIIAVTLATAPDLVKRRLRSKLTTDKDWARLELAKLIAAKVDNDSSMVVVTDMLGTLPYDRPGKWDIDEAAPAHLPERVQNAAALGQNKTPKATPQGSISS